MKSRYKRIVVDGRCLLEHRAVVEKALGRKLLSSEQIHHVNGNRYDNRIENLLVVTQAEHDLIHKWKYHNKKECVICGKEFNPSNHIRHSISDIVCCNGGDTWKI